MPASVNITPFHVYGNSLAQMVRESFTAYVGFTVKNIVTTLSQPFTVCKVTFCVPAAVNSTPFQMYGSSLAQIVRESLTSYVEFTVKTIVTTLSQSFTVCSVTVCMPASVNSTSFQMYGNLLAQIVRESFTAYVGFTVKNIVTTLSQPLTVCKMAVCVPVSANSTPFQKYGNSLSQIVMESDTA